MGVSFFQQTMSRNRCREIIRFLRFDWCSTKSARWQTDKFAIISDIWFVDNSISYYQPGENITIYVGLSSICQTNQKVWHEVLVSG